MRQRQASEAETRVLSSAADTRRGLCVEVLRRAGLRLAPWFEEGGRSGAQGET
jgi:hypothetical protein